jgi:hypothetical protein
VEARQRADERARGLADKEACEVATSRRTSLAHAEAFDDAYRKLFGHEHRDRLNGLRPD